MYILIRIDRGFLKEKNYIIEFPSLSWEVQRIIDSTLRVFRNCPDAWVKHLKNNEPQNNGLFWDILNDNTSLAWGQSYEF